MHETQPNILAILPLRNGSKGVPKKNLRMLSGKRLYQHTLDQAIRTVGHCIITTDIPDILNADVPHKCSVIRRPSELAEDDTPMNPVLFHLFETLEQTQPKLPEIAVLLQATSPLRGDEDILNAIALHLRTDFELVMSVTQGDPAILKHGFSQDGQFVPVSNLEYCFANRQELPNVVKPNGAVYVFSPKTFIRNGGLVTDSIGVIEMPKTRSIDVDTSADFLEAEALLSNENFRIAS